MVDPTPTPFVPTFVKNPVEFGPGTDPLDPYKALWKTNLQPVWWATKETADALAKRYGAQTVAMPPYYPARWYRVSFDPGFMWYLQWPDGLLIAAGLIAGLFLNNPEATSPGIADRNVKQMIATAEAER